eukprot:3508400-Pyramimonas_sp.AAC.1
MRQRPMLAAAGFPDDPKLEHLAPGHEEVRGLMAEAAAAAREGRRPRRIRTQRISMASSTATLSAAGAP